MFGFFGLCCFDLRFTSQDLYQFPQDFDQEARIQRDQTPPARLVVQFSFCLGLNLFSCPYVFLFFFCLFLFI